MKKIAIKTNDKLLYRELFLLLSQNSYSPIPFDTVGADNISFDALVTDDISLCALARTVVVSSPFPHGEFLDELDKKIESKEAQALSLDMQSRVACAGKVSVKLTKKEAALLSLLLENKGKTVSEEEINACIGNANTSTNEAAVYIRHLREKLEGDGGERLILTIRGKGYAIK